MKKHKKSLLLAVLLLILSLIPSIFLMSENAYARHNINHCAEVVGSDNNAEFDACVAAAPDTRAEQSAWCEANRSDSEFESCMLNEFGVDVSVSANTPTDSQAPAPIEDDPIETDCNAEVLTSENCGIISLLVAVINVLSAIAGIAIVASIMIAGYQYMTAQDNSGRIQQARQRIVWAISALAILIFMYAFLNWLVPGGVL